jgi:hypothetical protein
VSQLVLKALCAFQWGKTCAGARGIVLRCRWAFHRRHHQGFLDPEPFVLEAVRAFLSEHGAALRGRELGMTEFVAEQ